MQKNYESYSAEQFLDDAFFIAWVKHKTPEAEKFWKAWAEGNPPNLKAMREAEAQLNGFLSARRIEVNEDTANEVWEKVQQSLSSSAQPVAEKEEGHRINANVRPLYKSWWAAAAVLLIIATVSFFLIRKEAGKEAVVVNKGKQNLPADVAPGGDKAVLTLADGQKIVLDSAANGNLSQQGGIKVIKLGGQLTYNTGNRPAQVLYNTVTTPKGGQFRLVLSEGSRVWLNAGSSLRFPTVFTGTERNVELTGEGYFEVAHNPAQPFTVKVGKMDVEVLGTHFNINSYADEPAAKTTLLEGKLVVKKGDKSLYLQPGQQAVDANNNASEPVLTVNREADADAVMAWKNGLFIFDNSDLPKILRDLSRWYDVEVQTEGVLSGKTLFGIVSRNSPLSTVMKQLKSGSPVPFTYRMEGKKLIVQAAAKN